MRIAVVSRSEEAAMMSLPALKSFEPPAVLPLPVSLLRRWLRNSWGVLFSHPDDFASYGFEADRWQMHVRDAFAAADVRPLALVRADSNHGAGWVVEAGGRFVFPENEKYPLWLQSKESLLSEAIRCQTTRFVITVDNSLRVRRTLGYTSPDRLPSPIALAQIAASVRRASASDSHHEWGNSRLLSLVPSG
jgi:hypothetical protein